MFGEIKSKKIYSRAHVFKCGSSSISMCNNLKLKLLGLIRGVALRKPFISVAKRLQIARECKDRMKCSTLHAFCLHHRLLGPELGCCFICSGLG